MISLGKCVRSHVEGTTDFKTGSYCPPIAVDQRPNGDVWLTQDGKTIVVDPKQLERLAMLLGKAALVAVEGGAL